MARLPSVIVIGVIRGGATARCGWPARHPDCAASDAKETVFFKAYRFAPAAARLGDCRRHHAAAADRRFLSEATPKTLMGGAPQARFIRDDLPDLRFALVPRDPVARFRSHRAPTRGLTLLPPDACLSACIDRCEVARGAAGPGGPAPRERDRGLYADPLEGRPDVFGEDLLIIQKEFEGFAHSRERLDLLALDKSGRLVVIENKLGECTREIFGQAVPYAAYASRLTADAIIKEYGKYLRLAGQTDDADERRAPPRKNPKGPPPTPAAPPPPPALPPPFWWPPLSPPAF